MKREEIEITIPKGFMNVGISVDNYLVADTNDSANYDDIKFPLPPGPWTIKSPIFGKKVILIKKDSEEGGTE